MLDVSQNLNGSFNGPLGSVNSSSNHLPVKTNKTKFPYLTKYKLLGLIATIALVSGTVYLVNIESNVVSKPGLSDLTLVGQASAAQSPNQSNVSAATTGSSQTTGSDSQSNASSTTVSVNGQSVSVPQNGSYSQTTTSSDGQTSLNVQSSHSSSSTGSSSTNSSSTDINLNSSSQ